MTSVIFFKQVSYQPYALTMHVSHKSRGTAFEEQ